MSHFTMLVIGDDVARQLQPFHEFECTGTNDEFVQDIDVTAELLERMQKEGESLEDALGWHGLEDRIVASEDEVDRDDEHKYGFAVVENGHLLKAIDRTNPNKKWDWWVVGGRWTGMFLLKSGADGELGEPGSFGHHKDFDPTGRADQARKGAIDWERMRNADGELAGKEHDAAHAVIRGRSFRTWEQVRDQDHAGNIQAAREAYHAQDVIRDFGSRELRKIIGWETNPADFLTSRDEFVARARRAAGVTFGVLKDGVWYERGEMGWFGTVHNGKDRDVWNAEFSKLIDTLPDDTLLTVVDCHI